MTDFPHPEGACGPVRRVAPDEVPALAAFGAACFREAYGGHFAAADLARLCAAAFSLPVMERLVRDGTWVAGDWQGYVALGQVACPIPGLAEPTLELARLYVAGTWQGRGVADRLMARFIQEARARGGRSVWLQAFAGSPRALAFYRRWGFEDHGPYVLAVEGLVLPHRMLGMNLQGAGSDPS
ncbi:MAG TPA: GNAT family N-acetyltransferase [Holophaga sp.]|nr:GNAT family N-acetyltransferase [Holophaga sp.]